jgi:hypothetical protein
MPPSDPHPHEFEIHIDGKPYKVTKTSMTGIELKTLANRDATVQLFLERKGNDPDQMIQDSQTVDIKNGEHFYTVPPATMGA